MHERTTSLKDKKTDAAQRAKRARVSRACDQCRAGREKCDGGQPSCQTCEYQGRLCTYYEQPKKRGIQPNYIRTLEVTLAWLFEKFPECETRLSHLLPLSDKPAHQLIAWKDATSSEALHTAWRNGIVAKQLDQLLSGAEVEAPAIHSTTANTQNDAEIHAEGQYQSPPLSASQEPQDPPIALDAVIDPPRKNIAQIDNRPHTLKLPGNSWGLLEHYFAFTQTWFPIVEKHDILKLMYTYPAMGLPKHDAIGSGHAELWSIMAFASLQISGPNADYELYKHVAKSLVPSESGFQLGHIKALLILGLSELARKAWLAAWLVVGSAVRLLTHFNLGSGTNTTFFDGRTKHTILAAFVVEHAIASRTNAVCHIRPEDIRSVGMLIEDGLEEWSPWQDPAIGPCSAATKSPARSISTFNSLVRTAMHHRTNIHVASPMSHSQPSESDAFFALLHNASSMTTRQHPCTVLASTVRSHPVVNTMDATSSATTGMLHLRSQSNHFDFIDPFPDNQYGYMSIPNEGTESLVGSTPANQLSTEGASGLWTADGPAEPQNSTPGNAATNDAGGGDIFEELAMLDRSDSTQNPKFMQNLGFGPDLDLAEFFGPDYQFTDPSTFSSLSQGLDGSSKDPD